MIKTAVMFILSGFVIFAIGFIAGIACAASGAAEHFETALLEVLRKEKDKKDADNGL